MEQKRLEEYIKKAKEIHGDKYDYSQSNAATCKDKTTFICPLHGEFFQTWDAHINGKNGCPKCGKHHKYTSEEWVEEANKRHDFKYDYSKCTYVKAKDKVTIICHEKDEFGNEHGPFQVRAGNHMAGIGCPKCAKKYVPTTEEWIERARKIHGDTYDYSKVQYIKQDVPVDIICKKHGLFKQIPYVHIQGCGCPKCNGGVKIGKEEFVKKANLKHHNRYDYSDFVYVNAKTPGYIKCPRHGVFEQTPDIHLRGHGCPKCKSSKLENILISLFNKHDISYTYQYKIQNDKVFWCDFFLDEYNLIIECQGEQHFVPTSFGCDKSEDVCIGNFKKTVLYDEEKYETCTKHGFEIIYFTIPSYFTHKNVDIYEGFYKDKIVFTKTREILKFLQNKNVVKHKDSFNDFYSDIKNSITKEIIKGNNMIKYNDYVVIYVPLKKNTRNELNDKRRMYKKRGYKTIIVFEDEYLYKREIVISKIKHLFGLNLATKIMARKCTIKEISVSDSNVFLNKNHIQGSVCASVYLGAFYNNKLIAVMTFLNEGRKNNWVLSRFASDNNYVCCGVGGKLFKYFIDKYDFNEIKSFADKRWTFNTEKNLYLDLGFKQSLNLFPDYHYIKNGELLRHHKFGFRKQILHRKYGLDINMTETEMAKELGYDRIWDCGLIKYVYKNPNYL